MVGAYIADTYLGRFNTICISALIRLAAHVILTVSAALSVLAHPHSALAVFIIGIIVMGIGVGGFNPNISILITEQVHGEHLSVRTEKNGERVIVDPAITTARIYNWFYLFINVGCLLGQVGMVYAERYIGFYLSFLIPTVGIFCDIVLLYLGKNW